MKIGHQTLRFFMLVGIVFLPFTELRIGLAGVGEILLAISFLLLLVMSSWRLSPMPAIAPLLFFWIALPVVISLGFSYTVLIRGDYGGANGFAIFDMASYLTVLVLILVLGDRNFYGVGASEAFFERVFVSWAMVFTVLFVLSQFTASIAGLPLRYFNFFSPLVTNLHQAAMVTSAMPFMMIFLASRDVGVIEKTVYLIFALLFILMALDSGSIKALLATLIGFVALIGMRFVNLMVGRKRNTVKTITFLLTVGCLLICLAYFWSTLLNSAEIFLRENDGGSAREGIYYQGLLLFLESPWFGHGPGPHINYDGELKDAHNTVLTLLLQGGVVLGVLFLVLTVRLIRRASVSSALIGVVFAIGIYALGGDILRRLPIWVIVISIFVFSSTKPASVASRS